MSRRPCALQVNEARVWANRRGAAFWVEFRRVSPSRIRDAEVSIGGNLVEVQVFDREHAEGLLATFVEQGIPAVALRVVG